MLSAKSEKIWLAVVMFVAVFLRLYQLNDIPFTHDEFSALYRSNGSSFADMIERGVKVDNHPALVQIFIFYWIKLVGTSALAIKLPFVLLGILSIYLTYKLGKRWFNAPVGLLSATVMACSQSSLMYSQVARPYITGVVFMLCVAWYWDKMVQSQFSLKYMALYVLFAALCCYNQYMGALTCFIFSVAGLFFIERKFWVRYLLCGVAIAVLFIPHVPVFLVQFSYGGNGAWQTPPEGDFILQFLYYTLHYSVYAVITMLLIIPLCGINHSFYKNRYFILSVITFWVTFIIGFGYSVLKNPILQYSGLLFAAPFLCFSFFGLFNYKRPIPTQIGLGALIVVLIVTLFTERKHYFMLTHSSSNTLMENAANEEVFATEKHPHLLLATILPDIKYYWDRNDYGNLNIHFLPEGNSNRLQGILDTLQSPYVAYGFISFAHVENAPLLLDKYPHVVKHLKYYGQDYYLLSRAGQGNGFIKELTTANNPAKWDYAKELVVSDSSNILALRFDSLHEYGLTYRDTLKHIATKWYNFIDFSVDISGYNPKDTAALAIALELDGKLLDWRGGYFHNYYNPSKKSFTVYCSVKLADIKIENPERTKLTFSVWNKKHGSFKVSNAKIRVREGNKYMYALYYPITD